MIETTTLSNVVQELPPTDPEFRVEPQAQLQLLVPSSLEVFSRNDQSEVQWSTTELPVASGESRRVLDQIVSASQRESERHPQSVRSRVNYGVALLNAGLVAAATTQFEIAHSIEPQNISVLAHLARVRLLAQKTDEARALGNEVRSLDSSNILGALLVASVDIIEDRSAAAADVLKSAARLDPENWVPEYLLGLVLIGQRQAREAIHHLRSANRNQPRSAAVHHALGVAFGLGGEWGKAIRAFREALVLAPRRRESVLALAHVLLRQDETEDAIGVLAERVSAWPQDREVQELLAHSYRETNDYRAAKRHLQVALQSIPEDEDYAISRARVLNNIGFCSGHLRQQEEAAEWYSRSIKAWPTMEAFRNLARVYRELGRLESALGVIANALAQNPDDAVAKLLGGVTAAQLGYLDEAISTLKGLTSGRGEVAQDAYASLGRILADEKRDYSAALEVSLRGHQRFPEDAVIVNNVAYVNLMLGNVDAARAVLHGVPEAGISQSIYLTATMGLLRLWQGDLEGAVNFYRAAERLAQSRGLTGLAATVRQKMHLEFARAYLRVDDRRSAEEHIKRGFPIKGRQSYHDDLRELRLYLREA